MEDNEFDHQKPKKQNKDQDDRTRRFRKDHGRGAKHSNWRQRDDKKDDKSYRGMHRGRRGAPFSGSRPSTPHQIDWINMQEVRSQSAGRPKHPPPLLGRTEDYGGSYNLENRGAFSNRGGGAIPRRNRFPVRNDIGFKRLQSFVEMDPDKLIIILCKDDVGLEKLIQTNLSGDYIVLILRVLSRMCESAFHENKGRILIGVCCKEFLQQLNLYLSDILLQSSRDRERNKFFWRDQELFWHDLANFYNALITIIPNTATELLPKLIRHTCITISSMEREQNERISDAIKETFEKLQAKMILCVEEREKIETKQQLHEFDEPPDDFRTMSLYPLVAEITTRERAFIRPNIIAGAYKNIDHYLDVQFRLLREDFVAPLRDGICDYVSQQLSKERKKLYNVKVYKNVQFIQKYQTKDKFALIVQLPAQNHRVLKLENSRRFMYGSLVCFTDNNFRSVIFGTICDREPKLLNNGQIVVDVLDEVKYFSDYVMVECSVYFEPYYHVLHALQLLDETNFPFERYIIDVESTVVYAPAYYTPQTEIEYRSFTFKALELHRWPTANELSLDPSQFKAFQTAITKEFCVIQGPPGTGKTYMGLKIAQLLLENQRVWNRTRGPILIICFTNHALDQFLEGILTFTDELVRIGGQSKCERLKNHNIRHMRNKFVRATDTNRLMFKKRNELRELEAEITDSQHVVDMITSGDKIIDFRQFSTVDANLADSWFTSKARRRKDIIDWLMRGRTKNQRNEERTKDQLEKIQAQMQINIADQLESDEEFFDATENEARQLDVNDDIFHKPDKLKDDFIILTSVQNYLDKITEAMKQLSVIENNQAISEAHTYALFDEKALKQIELNNAYDDLDYLKFRLNQFKSNNYPAKPHGVNYQNPSILLPDERWGLYFHWIDRIRRELINDVSITESKYRKSYRQYEEVKLIEDVHLLRKMKVVGMTTTGAARFQTILQTLKCPIVIVEEAAEVLEAHVVVSLTKDCHHLILIGDHQQLRPTTSEYRLAKDYNLEISLFERMVKNGIYCEVLQIQHRMRPEIVRLIVPAIYPQLENHRSVQFYPPVLGVTKNLFFLTHTEPEQAVDESGSRRNIHEARFLIRFAKYLIYQGYEPEEITILATYSGQMFALWNERKLSPNLSKVKITVVDNFQGEENKIILLSLVRSNTEANIGFLKTENRVCVALSRAKEGMFIMGNMDILAQNNLIWPKIRDVLREDNAIGTTLTLRCQIHTDQLTEVKMPEDFNQVAEGGCSKVCAKQLDCGHTCASMCHVTDREHTKYKCKENCTKILCDLGHQCPDLCFKECYPCMVPKQVTLNCEHTHTIACYIDDYLTTYKCPTVLDVELECGHKTQKPCHRDITTYPCPFPCDIRRICGHSCEQNCHIRNDPDHLRSYCFKPCAKYRKDCSLRRHICPLRCFEECTPCEQIVHKKRTICAHEYDIACHLDVDEIECHKPCKQMLPCDHKCPMKCFEPCGNCSIQVLKTVEICGHKVRVKCSETASTSLCKGKCVKKLPCGHPCHLRCMDRCTDKCQVLVDSPYSVECGHQFKIPCYERESVFEPNDPKLLRYCTEPCNVVLKCEHQCSGTCGECLQGRIHKSCQEKCGAILICNHPCETRCRSTCMPCTRKCNYRCVHSKCGKKCGIPCNPCKEPCPRRCEHGKCVRKCSDRCSIKPCTEPCPKTLKCKHPCIGFCGDPCPQICRQCDPDHETFQLLLGNEDEPDSIFVLLIDCGHVMESRDMERWFRIQPEPEENQEVKIKCCPKCSTPIVQTQRYADYVKTAYKDVIAVKKIWFGNRQQNENRRVQLLKKVTDMRSHFIAYIYSKLWFSIIVDKLKTALSTIVNDRRNPLNSRLLDMYSAKIQIIERMILMTNICSQLSVNIEYLGENIKYLVDILLNTDRLTDQQIDDFELELNRLDKISQYFKITANPKYKAVKTQPNIMLLSKRIDSSLKSIKKFTNHYENELTISLNELCGLVDKSLKISDAERLMIVRAIGLSKGKWFKCPNGHYYCIGECGGAMEKGKCPECGEAIGGSNHALLATNQHAREMDDSHYPAWSDTANNMANFDLH